MSKYGCYDKGRNKKNSAKFLERITNVDLQANNRAKEGSILNFS